MGNPITPYWGARLPLSFAATNDLDYPSASPERQRSSAFVDSFPDGVALIVDVISMFLMARSETNSARGRTGQ